jgi:hypothetical protein
MSRLDISQFHQCTWETSQLSYIDFFKELSMLAGKARIPDDSPSMIRLFIEKQPKDIKIGLNHLSITKGEYSSLRLCLRDAATLSTSYEPYKRKSTGHFQAKSGSSKVLTTVVQPSQKSAIGPCRLCESEGKTGVTWSQEHWTTAHPRFSKPNNRKRTLNNLEEQDDSVAEDKDHNTEMRESFWDLFAVVEEQDQANKVETNYNIEPAPLDAKLCFALLVVDKRDDLGKISGSRVCIDLKAINKVMLPDLYPLPTLQEVLSKAVNARDQSHIVSR